MSYDFHQLSPFDLETLVRDLLQAEWGLVLESFKTGRDSGVDLRYARGSQRLVVQVKHFAKTGLSGLIRELKVEAAKVAALRPTRYIIATSVPLSPANKQTIAAMFGDMLAAADVLGQDDLNTYSGVIVRSSTSITSSGWQAVRCLIESFTVTFYPKLIFRWKRYILTSDAMFGATHIRNPWKFSIVIAC